MSHHYKLGKIYVVTSVFLWLVLIQDVAPYFFKTIFLSSCSEWVFVGHISFGLVFLVHSVSLCLLIGIFSTFTFNETWCDLLTLTISVTLLQSWSILFYDYLVSFLLFLGGVEHFIITKVSLNIVIILVYKFWLDLVSYFCNPNTWEAEYLLLVSMKTTKGSSNSL